MEPKHAMSPTSSAADMARGRPVPWVIAAFFVAFIIPLLFFTWIAFQHKPDLITEHAYDKGLAYNKTLQSEKTMEALGWHAALALENNTLVVHLRGKDGKPIHGATAKAWFIGPAKATMDHAADMRETIAGRYEAALPDTSPGLWQMRVTVIHQGNQFQAARDFSVK